MTGITGRTRRTRGQRDKGDKGDKGHIDIVIITSFKNGTFFYLLFSSFWRLMKPKKNVKNVAFFSKEQKRT